MRKTSLVAAAIASAAVLALSASHMPAAAQKGGQGGGGARVSGGGAHFSAGAAGIRSGSRALGGARAFAGSGSRSYVNRGGGARHVRHVRGRPAYGYAPFVGGYAYGGSCDYYYRRALATGSSYWWSRYHDCIDD